MTKINKNNDKFLYFSRERSEWEINKIISFAIETKNNEIPRNKPT